MIRLHFLKTLACFQTRSFCSEAKLQIELLHKRTLLKLSGSDTLNYLQSMITNDTKSINSLPSLYSLLLNSQGRVLYDILLYKTGENEYLVEYDSSAVEHLHRHLLMYRLRKNVKIQLLNDLNAYVIYYSDSSHVDHESITKTVGDISGIITSCQDPRISQLGVRVIAEKHAKIVDHLNLKLGVTHGDTYRLIRYKLGIGEGVYDHPPGNCLPFETNVDFLNGVSFTKGCYIGQELTARAHFVLNVRKRLVPVVLQPLDSYPDFPPECHIQNEHNTTVGRLRSHLGKHGLGLLKFEEALKTQTLILKGTDVKLTAHKPAWWPDHSLPNKTDQ